MISANFVLGRSSFVFSDLAMLVFVETMAGNTITIDLALGIASGSEFWSVPDLWVMHLKVAISEQAKIPVCDQHLSFNSKVLNDTDTLESCKIVSNSLVQLLMVERFHASVNLTEHIFPL